MNACRFVPRDGQMPSLAQPVETRHNNLNNPQCPLLAQQQRTGVAIGDGEPGPRRAPGRCAIKPTTDSVDQSQPVANLKVEQAIRTPLIDGNLKEAEGVSIPKGRAERNLAEGTCKADILIADP